MPTAFADDETMPIFNTMTMENVAPTAESFTVG